MNNGFVTALIRRMIALATIEEMAVATVTDS
jgi:hypothetical protein